VLRAHGNLISSALLTVDVLGSALVFLLAVSHPELRTSGASGAELSLLIPGLVACLAWPLILEQLDLYESQRRRDLSQVLARLLLAGLISTVLVAASISLVASPVVGYFPLAVGTGQFVVLASVRALGLMAVRAFRRRGHNTRYVLIVGSGTRARHVLQVLQRHREWGLRVVGFLDDGDSPHDPRIPAERIQKLIELPNILKQQVIDEVIVACPRSMLGDIGPVVSTCASAGVPMTLLSDLFGDYLPPPRVTRFGSLAALSFAPVHHSRSMLVVKRAIDVVGAVAALVVVSPVIAIAAIAIKISSSGPVFFRQMRCGQYGRVFRMCKLRTMVADAEARQADLLAANEMTGPVFKMRDDPRITTTGKWLRRLSLDELPQFWNVLRGDMSLVGPRPPLPHEVAEYATFDRRRLSMRPGITCLWQVGGRNTIDFDGWVKLDLEYIDTWSLTNDVKILLRTIPAIIRGTGM
jgi:exopolysaccharide biosynthesis polyprenyl glycosylphosphotransferase